MESESDSSANSIKTNTDEEFKKLNASKLKEDNNVEIIPVKSNCWPTLKWIIKYFISLCLGFLFGYAMEKAKVYEPKAIRQQMVFRRFIMLKMFLAAFASSMCSILLVALIFKKKYEYTIRFFYFKLDMFCE